MNRDFHYYGTYIAACLAGYNNTEATIIAHAATYVDDHTRKRLICNGKSHLGFHQIPTSHSMVKDLVMNRPSEADLRRVWVPFHFLPGNLSNPQKVEYHGPKSAFRLLGKFYYDDKARREFRLMCLPESDLARDMINDIIISNRNRAPQCQNFLHLIGIRMHALADTRAHNNFSGTVSWHVNDICGEVKDLVSNKPVPYSFFKKGGVVYGPDPKTSFNTISFLGHGRMGSILDYSWLKFEYTPRWCVNNQNGKTVVHDNPSAYLQSIREMYTALSCIRSGRLFDFSQVCPLDKECEAVIVDLLKTPHEFGIKNDKNDIQSRKRCRIWETALGMKRLSGMECSIPEPYDEEAWFNDFKEKRTMECDTNYYLFNLAAIIHRDFVEAYLNKKGIDLIAQDLLYSPDTFSIS